MRSLFARGGAAARGSILVETAVMIMILAVSVVAISGTFSGLRDTYQAERALRYFEQVAHLRLTKTGALTNTDVQEIYTEASGLEGKPYGVILNIYRFDPSTGYYLEQQNVAGSVSASQGRTSVSAGGGVDVDGTTYQILANERMIVAEWFGLRRGVKTKAAPGFYRRRIEIIAAP